LRRDYSRDPTLGDRVFELLGIVFPEIPLARHRALAERFGAPWEAASTPFVHEAAGRVVSHVGLLTLPLLVRGRLVAAGGVHGVATHPDRRRRGLYRALMEELLGFASERYDTLVLTTARPDYFEPFGFRVVPERIFTLRAPPPARRRLETRRLDLADPADRALMHRLLDQRAPLSDVLCLGPAEKCVWGFYEAASVLTYAPSLDLALIAEQSGRLLRIIDVIASRVPTLDSVLETWGMPVSEVLAFLNPDRMGGSFEAAPHDLAGGPRSLDPGGDNTWLMARGPFPAEGLPLMLPRPARC
jgi:predicted N-acetyltransferase YhbS